LASTFQVLRVAIARSPIARIVAWLELLAHPARQAAAVERHPRPRRRHPMAFVGEGGQAGQFHDLAGSGPAPAAARAGAE
jgi:hypothetical protein